MPIYLVRADYGKYTQQFKEKGLIALGFLNELSEIPQSWEQIQEIYEKTYPEHKKMQKAVNVGQIYRFLHEMQVGDIVLSPYDNDLLIVGEVESAAYYDSNNGLPWPCTRRVKWMNAPLSRSVFSVPLQNTLRSMQTVFRIKQENEVLRALGRKPTTDDAPEAGFDTDKLIEQIRHRLLKLDAYEFELLVNYVLQSLGFEAKQRHGGVGDGGVDFEGILNVMGVAKIQLQVQVKRYEQSAVGERDIRNLRGALKTGHQGCFITLSTFQKKAVESADDPEKTPIRLIDGRKFIEILTEQYDKVMDLLLEDDQEELIAKLKFRKGLLPE